MRFFGFGERMGSPEIIGSHDDLPEISQHEIAKLDERQYPYQSLVRVFRKDESVAFQSLEPADQPEINLQNYRTKEISEIMKLLESNNVVSLIGPSRSAKTEAVLLGDYNTIGKEDTLYGKTDGYFFDAYGQFGTTNCSEEQLQSIIDYRINKLRENRDTERNKVAIFDEFDPEFELHSRLLQELLKRDFKCVISQGGFLSNHTKKTSIEQLSSKLNIPIPSVEMGIKPFNVTQLQDMCQLKNGVGSEINPNFKLLAALSSRIPMPYHVAVNSISGMKYNPVSEEQIWTKLHDPHSGVYSINELKKAVKKKQQSF